MVTRPNWMAPFHIARAIGPSLSDRRARSPSVQYTAPPWNSLARPGSGARCRRPPPCEIQPPCLLARLQPDSLTHLVGRCLSGPAQIAVELKPQCRFVTGTIRDQEFEAGCRGPSFARM